MSNHLLLYFHSNVIPQYNAPSQSVETAVNSISNILSKCSASSLLVYLTPKSSTTSVN